MVLVPLVYAATPQYVSDPTECPSEDAQFPGQKCSGGLNICGVDDSTGTEVTQCYDNSTISAPGSTTSSNTQYTASLGGGYIIDCYADVDAAAPYCDNNGSWLCNRDESCYTTQKRATTCTGAGAFTCGDCRSGYQDCTGDSTCEVQTNVTNYPTGANNNYGASCAAQCDTNYLDCDGGGEGAGDGCEILDGGSCGTNAVYDGCSAGAGNCVCSSGYNDCDASGADAGNGCEIQTGAACTTAQGATGTYNGCTCVPTKSYFQTGTESVYATSGSLLWGTQLGTGKLVSMSNADGEQFAVYNSGAVRIGTFTEGSGTGAGTLRWTGGDFQGYTGSAWVSFTAAASGLSQSVADGRYVQQQGDTMTGGLLIHSTNDTSVSIENGLLLEIAGTSSGWVLHAQDSITSSGTLVVEGNALFASTLTVGGVTYTFPTSDGTSSGKVLATDGNGNLSWTDAAGGTSFTAGRGLALSASVLTLNASITGSTLSFTTISGGTLHAESLVTSSGGMVVEGATVLNGTVTFGSTLTLNGVTYTFPTSDGSSSGKILATDGAGNLSWTDAADPNAITQATADARYVMVQGDTMTGGLLINLGGSASASIDSSLALEVVGTMSGRILHAQDLLTSSGGLIAEGATTLNGTVTFGSTVTLNGVTYTFPTSDGSASGKVLKTNSAGQLSWSADIDTDTNTTY
ncbi:MAG: Filamentous hemagglutinin, partial [Candidatus Peribacteria bacterium GW2011_GWC2_54_8]